MAEENLEVMYLTAAWSLSKRVIHYVNTAVHIALVLKQGLGKEGENFTNIFEDQLIFILEALRRG